MQWGMKGLGLHGYRVEDGREPGWGFRGHGPNEVVVEWETADRTHALTDGKGGSEESKVAPFPVCSAGE